MSQKKQHQARYLARMMFKHEKKNYRTREIWPGIQSGEIVECEMHKTFQLLPPGEYCGIKLHKLRQRIAWLESKPAWWQIWKMKKWKESEPR